MVSRCLEGEIVRGINGGGGVECVCVVVCICVRICLSTYVSTLCEHVCMHCMCSYAQVSECVCVCRDVCVCGHAYLFELQIVCTSICTVHVAGKLYNM